MYCFLASYNGAWGGAVCYMNGSSRESGFYWAKNSYVGPGSGTYVSVPTSTLNRVAYYWDNTLYDEGYLGHISTTQGTGSNGYRWDFTPVLAVHD